MMETRELAGQLGQDNNQYPNGNFILQLDYLQELIFSAYGEKGRSPIPEEEGGYQDLLFNGSEDVSLAIPEKAVSATVFVEADLLQHPPESAFVFRFKENGTTPTLESGFPLANGDVYEVNGRQSLLNFRAIPLFQGNHFLRIQYYQSNRNL